MSTKPIETILTRDIYKTDKVTQDFANEASELIDEIANFYTVVFHNSIQSSPKENSLEDAAIFLLLLNAVELADGISVSIKNGLILSGFFQVRSLFEEFLYIKYLTIDKKRYLQRSISFLIYHEKADMFSNDQFIGGTNQNALFVKALNKNEIKISFDGKAEEQRAQHNNEIYSNRLEEIERRWPKIYSEFQSEYKSSKNWYTYFNGPGNLRELAEIVNRPLDYILIYKTISEMTHCTHVISSFGKRMSKSNTSGYILRDISKMHELSTHTLNYLISILAMFIDFIFLEYKEPYAKWYTDEISAKHKKLIKV
jgi:hypothetical protein